MRANNHDSSRTCLAGVALFSTAIYRCLEIFIAKNFAGVRIISLALTLVAAFVFYVSALLPAVDPVLGLSRTAHEVSSLIIGLSIAGSITSLANSTLRDKRSR